MGAFTPSYFTPVEIVGLYWHFVDLVWIYLFPLLYLISKKHGVGMNHTAERTHLS